MGSKKAENAEETLTAALTVYTGWKAAPAGQCVGSRMLRHTVEPHFRCPACGRTWESFMGKIDLSLDPKKRVFSLRTYCQKCKQCPATVKWAPMLLCEDEHEAALQWAVDVILRPAVKRGPRVTDKRTDDNTNKPHPTDLCELCCTLGFPCWCTETNE
eukprot:m51a1_g13766 hypothetical protein (158) ;mRNA; f:257350-257823